MITSLSKGRSGKGGDDEEEEEAARIVIFDTNTRIASKKVVQVLSSDFATMTEMERCRWRGLHDRACSTAVSVRCQ